MLLRELFQPFFVTSDSFATRMAPGKPQVNADIKAQVTGYLLRQNYKDGAYVTKGQPLFEIDPRTFQAALDQAKGQLAQAEAQLNQEEARLATAEANQLNSQLDVEKYGPLPKADAVSKQDFDNAVQTNLANQAQVKAANAAIGAAKAQIQASQAAVETATINLTFTHIVSLIDGVAGIAQGAGRRFSERQQWGTDDGLDARAD